jgi:hypothetical protein
MQIIWNYFAPKYADKEELNPECYFYIIVKYIIRKKEKLLDIANVFKINIDPNFEKVYLVLLILH